MKNTKTADKDIWIKASVIGSLWASVEIIMGSFFHNLQLPFAGTMLAFFTVAFVVSVLQIWPSRGLIWRAGLICAIMKSISPSAVILGPMTGIFLEAVLIELFIFLFGRNLMGYIIAGIMAMLSVLFHKLFTLLIIYGWDAVTILSNLYHFAMKQLHVSNIDPMHAIWILVSVYIFLGTVSAVFGYFIGKKANGIKNDEKRTVDLKFSEADDFIFLSEDQKFSVSLLVLNIILVVTGLLLINLYGLYYGLAFAVFYILFSKYRYKNALRQFRRPFLWVQLITLTILAWLFYMDNGEINFFNTEGLIVGIEMAIRAVIVILGFSAISVELRNPIIKTVLYKKGFSNFYNALGLAFSALPAVISNISKPREIIKKPFDTIVNILLYTDSLYVAFSESEQQKNKHHNR